MLSYNVVEARAMLISTNQRYKGLQNRSHDLCVKIKGTELDTVKKTRYLGVNIDISLDWKVHIKAISSKVSRVIGSLNILEISFPKIHR